MMVPLKVSLSLYGTKTPEAFNLSLYLVSSGGNSECQGTRGRNNRRRDARKYE